MTRKQSTPTIDASAYPILEAGDSSFPEGSYEPTIEMGQDGCSAKIEHKITGAPFIKKLISEGVIGFYCHLSDPKANFSELHKTGRKGTIKWKESVVSAPPELRPMLVYTGESQKYTLTKESGVSDLWKGRTIILPKGARLARGNFLNINPSEYSFLRFKESKNHSRGSIDVKPREEEGFYFEVTAAPDIFNFVQGVGSEPLRGAILTAVMARCFSILANDYREYATNNNDSFRNLKLLSAKLNKEYGCNWSDDNFDPMLAATKLYPFQVSGGNRGRRMATYRELNDADCSDLRDRLIAKQGSALQKEFLETLKNSKDFIKWIGEKVGIEEGAGKIALTSDNLLAQISEHEFKDPSKRAEEALFKKWGSMITPAQACRPSFWGYVTLRHIEEGQIESHYLAANNNLRSEGLARIDRALNGGDVVKIDDAVRTALRHFSGLPEVRGNKSVYSNCHFARAWWRCYVAKNICDEIPMANPEKVMEVLRINQSYWEELIISIVMENAAFSGTNIRSALVWTLSEKLDDKNSSLFSADHLRKIIKKIGKKVTWQELAIFTPEELRQLFENEFLA